MKNSSSGENNDRKKPYDLTEESSHRPGDEKATLAARFEESDDVNEQNHFGNASSPAGDEWAENKLASPDD